ncbi:MAG: precorrin-3B C(17)-methyltransferase, partial [Desulfuromonadales bacterium C00003096]
MTIVSLGPGDPRYLAPKARTALMRAEVIVGYKTYIDLIEPELLVGKETISTGMMKEIIRSQTAIDRACHGKDTVVVSSGDAGIYGMAGLVLELLAEQGLMGDVEVEVIPGIPALSAAAALLGAPLMHDFAVISLSDLMIPWEVIRQRVEAAVKADFVLVIYNPKSKKRDWQLEEVRELIRKYRGDHMPVGMVRNAMRQGQSVQITTLSHLDVTGMDMLSILVVGNSRTRLIGGKMVTSRGYLERYGIKNLEKGVSSEDVEASSRTNSTTFQELARPGQD